MIDITKEELWDNTKYEEISRKESKLKNLIRKNKIMSVLLISLAILMTLNTVLIYKFFTILQNI